jgi:hypothetical protein
MRSVSMAVGEVIAVASPVVSGSEESTRWVNVGDGAVGVGIGVLMTDRVVKAPHTCKKSSQQSPIITQPG